MELVNKETFHVAMFAEEAVHRYLIKNHAEKFKRKHLWWNVFRKKVADCKFTLQNFYLKLQPTAAS